MEVNSPLSGTGDANALSLEERLRKSVKLLRGWRWMSRISNCPVDAIEVLTNEARFLVRLGTKHPEKARDVGKLIVAYERQITELKALLKKT